MDAVETIVGKMKTALASITTGGGYNNNVHAVYRRLFLAAGESSTDFPLLKLYTDSIEWTDPEDKVSMSYTATITVEGWVALGDDEEPETALNGLQQDITDLVYSDPTWTGSAVATDVVSSEYVYGERDSAVIIQFKVHIYEVR